MEDRIEKAMKYHGWNEWSDHSDLNRVIGDIDVRKTAWCAAFVTTIERQCGAPGTGSLMARSYLKYGKPITEPTKGCIVVLKRSALPWGGHVGYFLDIREDAILILGGNQDNMVCKKWYNVNRLLGYREFP